MVVVKLQDEEAKMVVSIIESYAEAKREKIDFDFMREMVHLADRFSTKAPVVEKLSYAQRHELLKDADCIECTYYKAECEGIDKDICRLVER